MKKLLNWSMQKFVGYAAFVLACSIPVYYVAISLLWQYEMDEHNIVLTPEAGREDKFLIIGAVTLLTVLFFAALLAGFILLNRRISRKLWQPFYQSLEQFRKFDLDRQRAVSFPPTNIEEFADLNQSLEKLIAGNIAAYDQQKEFADNASHELQTPLAIVQSKLELLQQDLSLNTRQYQLIEEAQQALSRVNRVNKNLLLLTRIGNSQFMDKESIILSGLLAHCIEQLQPFSDSKQLSIQTSLAPDLTVQGNKILVELLLNNLLTNTIRHSPANGSIHVELTPGNLIISNPGTTALDPGRLFKRFATATDQTPGTGLGLALVKQIADRYGWSIHYHFIQGRHQFTLQY
ncbi:MAG: HAMP domain-containing sensor histidine kinase [Candidatus Pseudobacter hemicellulosilyticus]|uniref:histidine kinase n=1 Tax=Candidatus Pseudobacter hemicellulosilyticus TaxID=3121375 RepID=A0AAJ5WS88_9BACT|nr:MAG: HAMP domain-containing sensor histidine kinase [Pseudobacter sp.]